MLSASATEKEREGAEGESFVEEARKLQAEAAMRAGSRARAGGQREVAAAQSPPHGHLSLIVRQVALSLSGLRLTKWQLQYSAG